MAKLVYEEALQSVTNELTEFEEQRYLNYPMGDLPQTDIKARYRTVRLREQALIIASEDLLPLLTKSGLTHEKIP